MRFQVSRIVMRSHQAFNCQGSRSITTSSDPRKASGPFPRVKEEIRQPGSVQDSLLSPVTFPKSDIFSFFFKDLHKWNNKVHNECGFTGRKYTYSETFDGALRWGAALRKLLPHQRNPTIAFISTNSPEFVTLFLGTLAAGAIFTPMNPTYTAEEIAYQLKDSGADMIVVDSFLEPLADGALKFLKKDLPVIVMGPDPSQSGRPVAHQILVDSNAPMIDPGDIDPQSIAILPYSSGTTGRPKGVRINHESLVNSVAMCMHEQVKVSESAEGDHQCVQMGILPFFHIFGIMGTLLCGGHCGVKTIMVPKFDPKRFISLLKNNDFTNFQLVPLLLQFIAENPSIKSEDLQRVEAFVCGAAPLPEETAKVLKKKAPNALVQEGFGMTESLVTHLTPKLDERLGFCGKLLSNCKAKVVDVETGELLPANATGELYIQSPSLMSGYHNNEAATKAIIDDEGWLQTGDLAVYTEDGFYSIVDRIKELIKVKGLQVSPTEVEETIQLHPGVAEAGVVGVPHPRFGEAPLAYIVKSDPDLTEEDVHSHLKEHLSVHKQLSGGIKFLSQLPRNQTGKLLRRILKEMATKT